MGGVCVRKASVEDSSECEKDYIPLASQQV